MRIRSVLAAVLVLGGALTGVAAAATASAALPRPTGPYAVGRSVLDLRDDTRADPWVPSERRELMVSVWYPARTSSGQPSPYMTPAESAALLGLLPTDIPPDALAKVRTNSTVDAPPRGGKAPIVVLSPGFEVPRSTLTTQAEELASRGYVVAGIDHNHEAAGITFADGHTSTCVACGTTERVKVVTNRAKDVSFVLDRLTANPKWSRLIDCDRIAMIGHSIGGSSVVPSMLGERRIKAGAILDGDYVVPANGIDRPILQFGEAAHVPGGTFDPSWDAQWPNLGGWKRWLTMPGEHFMFTDATLLLKQLGFDPDPENDPLRNLTVTRTYLGAFADRHLRGIPSPLLDRPSPRFPEVSYWQL